MTETSNTITNPFERGDRALHKNNQLDERPVESVDGDAICLRIGSIVSEPLPAANYIRIPGRCPATGRSAAVCEFVDHRTCAVGELCSVCKVDDDPSQCEDHGLCCDACHDADVAARR